jgi:hypothetical protein
MSSSTRVETYQTPGISRTGDRARPRDAAVFSGSPAGKRRLARLANPSPTPLRHALRRLEEGESPRTSVIALLANVVIGIAKLIAGLASGSSGLIAEDPSLSGLRVEG